jgi:hypothetical protein
MRMDVTVVVLLVVVAVVVEYTFDKVLLVCGVGWMAVVVTV